MIERHSPDASVVVLSLHTVDPIYHFSVANEEVQGKRDAVRECVNMTRPIEMSPSSIDISFGRKFNQELKQKNVEKDQMITLF